MQIKEWNACVKGHSCLIYKNECNFIQSISNRCVCKEEQKEKMFLNVSFLKIMLTFVSLIEVGKSMKFPYSSSTSYKSDEGLGKVDEAKLDKVLAKCFDCITKRSERDADYSSIKK